MDKKRIVVMGFMGGCPIAGVVWQHIHYIVGLQQLGHEVYYIEDSARIPYNPVTFAVEEDYSFAAATLGALAERFGFQARWGFCARYLPTPETVGLSLEKIRDLYVTADAILNVCGTQEFNEDLLRSERILYVESDPGVEQIKIDKSSADKSNTGTLEYLLRHRRLFSFGENVGTDRFPVPLHNLVWLPTRQPVVTEFWKTKVPPPPEAMFTTVANWSTSGKKDIDWRGNSYLWSKSLEFMKYVDAPACAKEPFELATDINDPATNALFLRNGWKLVPPHDLSADYEAYRNYIRDSKGEFTAAKDQYVRLETGWFSDRSACYLAAGRPVITQDTAFTAHYGGEAGLFAFRTMDDIIEAVRAINSDYAGHSRAAAEIASQTFEATKVLSSLLERAGI